MQPTVIKIDDKTYSQMVNNVWEKENQNVEVTLIIPSYNKYPLNLFSLFSVETQTFDLRKLEVIFIDDASTDATYTKLKNYEAPYPFRYIRCRKNVGRANARNIGIKLAKGSIIVFIDSEMLVPPNFIMGHVEEHEKVDRAVVTGGFHLKNAYTVLYHDFDESQLGTIKRLAKKNPVYEARFKQFETEKENGAMKKKIWNFYQRKDILEQKYKEMVHENRYFANSIIDKYGISLRKFMFPWMAFLSGNVSVRKDFLTKVGMFDEAFRLYGYEDWELGFRLYKAGATFIPKEEVASYHQEHPISDDKRDEALQNYHLFTEKHPDVDVYVLGLEIIELLDLHQINHVFRQYEQLLEVYPNEFVEAKAAFIDIIKVIPKLLITKRGRKEILKASGIDREKQENIRAELRNCKERDQYRHFIRLFEEKLFKMR